MPEGAGVAGARLTGASFGWPAGWSASRWVSNPDAIHLTGPGGVEFDLMPDDDSDAGVFLRALALCLLGAVQSSPDTAARPSTRPSPKAAAEGGATSDGSVPGFTGCVARSRQPTE